MGIKGMWSHGDLASILAYLSISPPDIFAGFCGGAVNFIWFRLKGSKSFLGAVVAGALTANWLGVLAGVYLGATAGHVGAFFIGLFGLKLVGNMMKKVNPNFFEELNNGTG